MPKGGKPLPTALKVLRGSFLSHPERRNHGEPKVEVKIPEAPRQLSAGAKREWARITNDLVDLGVVALTDRSVLASYCEAYAEWERLSADLNRRRKDPEWDDVVVAAVSGGVRMHPLIAAVSTARREMLRYLIELGLTPAARSRIDTTKTPGRGKVDDAPKVKKYLEA
jgi:P27 family predicted phage terminase small subunit